VTFHAGHARRYYDGAAEKRNQPIGTTQMPSPRGCLPERTAKFSLNLCNVGCGIRPRPLRRTQKLLRRIQSFVIR
jgi:hypothetical protein